MYYWGGVETEAKIKDFLVYAKNSNKDSSGTYTGFEITKNSDGSSYFNVGATNVLATKYSNSNDENLKSVGLTDVYPIKFNSKGNISFTPSSNATVEIYMYANCIQEIKDGTPSGQYCKNGLAISGGEYMYIEFDELDEHGKENVGPDHCKMITWNVEGGKQYTITKPTHDYDGRSTTYDKEYTMWGEMEVIYIKVTEEVPDGNSYKISDGEVPKMWEPLTTKGMKVYLGGWKYQDDSALANCYKKKTGSMSGYYNPFEDDNTASDGWKKASTNIYGNEDPYKKTRKDVIVNYYPDYNYHSFGNKDGRNEFLTDGYSGSFMLYDSKHGDPFTLPCFGDIIKLEPESNGLVTLYVVQNGAINYNTNNNFDIGSLVSNVAYRPVYIADEAGRNYGEDDGVTASTETEITIGRGDEEAWVFDNSNQNYLLFRKVVSNENGEKVGTDENVISDYAYTDNEKNYTETQYKTSDEKTIYTVTKGNEEIDVVRVTYKELVDEAIAKNSHSDEAIKTHTNYEFYTKTFKIDGKGNGEGTIVGVYDEEKDKETKYKLEEVWPLTVRTDDNKDDRKMQRVWGPKYTDNGWIVISKGFVKYEIPVKAGKSYYVFANNTKLGFCGYEFKPDDASDLPTLTLTDKGKYKVNDGTEQDINGDFHNEIADEDKSKTFASVTLDRKFHAGWNAICLPFSVTESKMREWFGSEGKNLENYELVTYNGIEEKDGNPDRLWAHFFRHVYQDIIAGYPYMLYIPEDAKAIKENVTFNNVTIEKGIEIRPFTTSHDNVPDDEALNDLHNVAEKDYFTFYGTYQPTTVPHGSYLVTSEGLHLYTSVELPGLRSYMSPKNAATGANDVTVVSGTNFSKMLDNIEDNYVTVINDLLAEELGFFNHPTNVYSISGQMVRANSTSLAGLPKGIYIINGKKYVVK